MLVFHLCFEKCLCFGKCFFEKPSQSGAVAKTVTEQSHFVFLQVLTDSVQFGDRECFDATLGAFSNFNEPYYAAYINTDLGALCWLCSLFSLIFSVWVLCLRCGQPMSTSRSTTAVYPAASVDAGQASLC